MGVLFDDIIVYSHMLEKHKLHLQSIVDELRENKLYLNGKRIEFFMQEIKNLGHIVSNKGILMDCKKLRVIQK